MELFKNPVAISVALIIVAVVVKLWFDARKDKDGDGAKKNGKKKLKGYGKKAKDFGKTTMRLVRRKALRKSLENGDWDFK
jgi:hypothetical protein